MDRQGFVTLAILGFALVIASFFVRGFGQLLLGRGIAEVLQSPIVFAGFGILVYLFVRATLDAVGVWTVEDSDG
ncbi:MULTISPECIES: hypothetical protein [Natrialba]|uniref:Uncharacterized protein n=1 Tax=Natrialba swarupiae TaxID=2448032 RepID=A0A5D5AN90_9EURY|nr:MULTISPECIES: hypothetical protein [Natrialba]MWV41181.1 hypothetical protein [Natrialba sp. INN-245]TYT60880.1 hypothetical protein FYC77_16300 [Natrialba swarupiae]